MSECDSCDSCEPSVVNKPNKKDILNPTLDDIEKIKSIYGIALVFIKSNTMNNDILAEIAELVSYDEDTITIKNSAIQKTKVHFRNIVGIDGKINPLVTVPENYSKFPFDLIFLNKSNLEVTVNKKELGLFILITNKDIISYYLTCRGNINVNDI